MSEAFLLDGLDIHDGDVTVTTGFSLGESTERQVFLPLRITTTTRAQAVAKVDRIAAIISQERYELRYTPDGGSTSVLDLRAGQLKQKWDVQAENQAVIDVDLTLPAEDFIRAATPVTSTPSSYTPVAIEAFDSATSAYTVVAASGGALTSDTLAKTEGSASLRVSTFAGVPVAVSRTGLSPVVFDRLLHSVNVDVAATLDSDALVTLTLLARDAGSLTLPAQRAPAGGGFTELVFTDDGTATTAGDFADNLLTDNQASIETDATGWTGPANCTLARVTTQAYAGAASLRMTATAAGLMNAQSSTFIPVTAGQTAKAVARFKAATVPRQVQVLINFYTAASVFVAQVVGTVEMDTTTGWTYVYAEGVAPATATKFLMFPQVLAAGAGEQHYADGMGAFVDAQLPHPTSITGFRLDVLTTTVNRVNFDRMRRLQDGAGASGLFSFSHPQGSAPTPVSVQVSQAAAITYALIARWPGRPAGFNPALTINNTSATVSIPAYAYRGSFAVVAEITTPGASAPTITVTASQTPPTPGASKAITVVGAAGAKLVPVGFLTLPLFDVDPVNVGTTVAVNVVSTLTVGRLWLFPVDGEVLRLDIVNAAGVAPKRLFIDPPDTTTDVPRVLGSPGGATDRYDAVSLTPWIVGQLHPQFEPSGRNQLYVVTNDSAAVVTASYYPKWFGARP